jgi:hypothetical protein
VKGGAIFYTGEKHGGGFGYRTKYPISKGYMDFQWTYCPIPDNFGCQNA